ncbi:sigma-70 family RNA polymerase sigma factor [Frankia sp. AgB32]|uniref:sigma-70 family RNA polymerase sigma factor n=1 Tax=Frankia sp. AgB32 TaxID=631119 RepID=UPI00200F6686|nr:sigma-70 family RNA polymerase sigma factor [Frankia sp. AgB32]MCK9893638.1 sigma-70 family RNA polymerase sigma factor [Frankia sp. AgB32]
MTDDLVEIFEEQRARLRTIALRMLGSAHDADDAVQETWLRLGRADRSDVENLPGWLTTVLARICLDQLRARRSRREDPAGVQLPEPLVTPLPGSTGASDPEAQALLADAVGRALLAVLDTLGPPERIAFVLHDAFGVPFDEIAPIVGRSPAAAAQLASRARRRLRAGGAATDSVPHAADAQRAAAADPAQQRRVVEAFQAAAREGDLARLLAVLDPDVVLRADAGPPAAREVRGARAVAARVSTFAPMAPHGRPALVDGLPGIVVVPGGEAVVAVLAFTVHGGRIAAISVHTNPDLLRHLDPAAFVGQRRSMENSRTCVRRMLLPDGSRNDVSMP